MKKRLLFLFPMLLLLSALFMNSSATADQAADFEKLKTIVSSDNVTEAQESVEAFLGEYPAGGNGAEALYLLGQLQFQKAAYAEAVETFSKILLEYPGWQYEDRALFGLAISKIRLSDYPSASKTLGRSLFLYPQSEIHPETLYWMGETLYRNKKYAAALEKFEEFLQLYPAHRLGEYALESAAWCLEQVGKNSDAIEKRRQFLLKFPNSPLAETAGFCLATDLIRTGNYSAAMEQYLRIGGVEPSPGQKRQASSRAAILLAEMEKPQESGSILKDQASQADGNERLVAEAILANDYLQMKEYDEAAVTLKRLLEEGSGDYGLANIQLALAYMGLGDAKEALLILSGNGYGRDSTLQEVRSLLLVDCLLKLNQPNAAAETLSELVALLEPAQQSPDLLMILARALLLAGQYHQAEGTLALLSKNQDFCRRMPEVYYYYGFCLYQQSKYLFAGEQLEKFLRVSKGKLSVPAQFLLACSSFETERFDRALELYASVVEDEPVDSLASSAAYRAGLLSIIMKRYEYALSFFERFSAAHPAIAAAEVSDYFTGIAHMGGAHPEKAIPIYASISKSPAHVQLADNIIFCYALAEFEVGNYEEATRLLNNFPTQFADSDRIDAALFLAAASQHNKGAVAEAGSQFEKFASLFFTSEFSSRALLFAGLCEERLNHPEIALAFYQRALEGGLAADDRAAALSGQASAFMATGNHFQALAVLGRLSEESQSEAAREYALFWKGRLLYSAARWTEARNALDKFTNLHPASPFADDALFFSARAARMSNDYWEAVRLFQRLNFLYPNNELSEHAILEAAECKMEAGETELAEEDFKSFAERNVNSPLRSLALYDMANILRNSGEFAEALERFRVAASDQTDEMSAKCRLEIASCLVHLGRNDQAVAELVGVVRGAYPPGWAECAHLQVARLLEREGQVEQARQVYDAVARAYPLEAAGAVGQLGIDRLNREN